MSSVPKNKAELQKSISVAFQKILADYATIPSKVSREIGVIGNVKGTEISVSDTISYLIGWGKLVLKWYDLKSKNQPVDFPETGYKWSELGKLAQHFHSEYHDWSYDNLIKEFTATTDRILVLVESLDNQKLYGEAWFEKYTLGKMIQFNTSSPMANMRGKVRKFKKLNAIK
ncbi:ClbS/DfsB family four-helix bundle protein [Colwellia sp. D2M02]|uniref:ClbS/DfsB family four-helix bundle protein n=1 Tax=Colwellia sp. D2M02 TaxID=2841562 RepID=UPI001C08666B|nr:ClbS/DfsB family four-helix bundle protein [Colwellia sp. D2M02]MBU2892858.1 ClbS/DfsB family four-helix bundle protein [Colwellia sp. D2M02]